MKILLADDNITAQKLGTKILTDAGYEVISVSNGAAAMKKIAAEKPHLLILDVFMPGYTGLEVCEKVKNAPDTSRVPVLLTVTNMEPFNPGEGNRVRADGVMIKPFEASDLLAVVQKLEKKLGIASSKGGKGSSGSDMDRAPEVKLSPPLNTEFKDASYEEWKAPKPPAPPVPEEEEEQVTPKKQAPRIEMPHEIASAPVFGTDEITTPDSKPPSTAPAPERQEFVVHQEPPVSLPSISGFVDEEVVQAAAIPRQAGSAPAPAVDAAVEFNSEPQVGAVEVTPAPELEVTAQESPAEMNIAADPALVVNASAEITEFATKFGVPHPEEEPIGIVAPEAGVAFVPDLPVPSPDTPTVKIDALQHGAPSADAEPEHPAKPGVPSAGSDAQGWKPVMLHSEPAQTEAPITRDAAPERQPELQEVGNNSGAYSFELEMRRAFAAGMSSAASAVEAAAVEQGRSVSEPGAEIAAEPELPPVSETIADRSAEKLAADFVAEIEEAEAGRAAEPEGRVEIVSEPELMNGEPNAGVGSDALGRNAAAVTANETGVDTAALQATEDERISQAVERVLDRYRPRLIADIVRELKG